MNTIFYLKKRKIKIKLSKLGYNWQLYTTGMYSISQIYYKFYKTPFLTYQIGSKYTFVVTLNDSRLLISWSFKEFLMVLKSFEERFNNTI